MTIQVYAMFKMGPVLSVSSLHGGKKDFYLTSSSLDGGKKDLYLSHHFVGEQTSKIIV